VCQKCWKSLRPISADLVDIQELFSLNAVLWNFRPVPCTDLDGTMLIAIVMQEFQVKEQKINRLNNSTKTAGHDNCSFSSRHQTVFYSRFGNGASHFNLWSAEDANYATERLVMLYKIHWKITVSDIKTEILEGHGHQGEGNPQPRQGCTLWK